MGVVAVSLCSDQGLCFCKVINEADGRYHVEFEYVCLDEATVDERMLLRAVRAATVLTEHTRVVAVPHPGFTDTPRCHQQNMLIDALSTHLPKACVVLVRLVDRVAACEAVSGRLIGGEAMVVATGGNWGLRCQAECFGTPLNSTLYRLETDYMREEASKLLQDPTKCSNCAEAFAAYSAICSQPGALCFVADTLWNAVCEARNSVSTGYKRARAVGSFFYSDTYWAYDWGEEEDEGGQEEGSQEDGEDQQRQRQQQQQQPQQLPLLHEHGMRKRQHAMEA